METLLVKAANGDDYEAEFSFLKHHTAKSVKDTESLPGHLSILEVMLKEEISCFDEILLAVLKIPEPEKKLIQKVQTNL